jgi:O-methyltransferase involved in polyketide biosynthesis
MQTWKRARIEQLDLAIPGTLRFVPCDFETDTLAEALAQAGFAADAPALISWLGVTQYLSREAIAETLRWTAQLVAGSEMILTFIVPGPEAEWEQERVAVTGMHLETLFAPEQMSAVISEAHLSAQVFTPEQVNDLYFRDRDDGLTASTGEWLSVASVL